MKISELLEVRGLDLKNSNIMLVRHPTQVRDYKVENKPFILNVGGLYDKSIGYIEVYQSYQKRHIFPCNRIVSFIGDMRTRAKFIGVYQVKDRKPATEVPVPSDFLQESGLLYERNFLQDDAIFYQLERVTGKFDDLRNRVVIEWGKSRAWYQSLSKGGNILNDKEVIEILPDTGRKTTDFQGYDKVHLEFDELVNIINHPDSNRDWHQGLSAVAGVYLILDRGSGKQYVGSAYGESGILGRWKEYTKPPYDGGNKELIELVAGNKYRAKRFQFSILDILPKSFVEKKVLELESEWKKKLGSIEFGLNSK